MLRETDRSLVEFQIIRKPDVRDYMREELRDSKKNPVSQLQSRFYRFTIFPHS